VQPAAAPPRDTLTAAAVTSLIQDSPSLIIGRGCDLLDSSLNVLDDLTADLAGGSVARESYATLHGSATLQITRDLSWGNAIVRPWITLSDGTTTATFRLGAYYTGTPNRRLQETPATYEVTCYDILSILDDPPSDGHAVAAGTAYLTEVEAILIARGVSAYVIDQTASASVLPTDRVWAVGDSATWLTVVNDLLGSIGYQGIWSDWDGRLHCQPYETPRARAPEWVYTVDAATSMLAPERTMTRDFYSAPNRWVFYRSNNVDDSAPVDGDGLYVYTNDSYGDTSVEARGGRVITKAVGVDAADQTSLIAAAQRTIDADMSIPTKVEVSVSPNPLHWHFDRAYVVDPAAGAPMDVLVTAWTLPLDGADMSQAWTVL
jgi:hypothetical protein